MITGAIKSRVDQIWNAFWSGGISNPMKVIEQMTYLLFIKRLDELQTVKERKAARTGQGVMEAGQLYEPPFTALHHDGLDGAFGDADANAIVAVITAIKRSAAA